jgi:hypothetical protein
MEMTNYATEEEIPVTVKFDYQPAEDTVFYPNDIAHPGCDAEVTINEVDHHGLNIIENISYSEMQRLEYDCFEFLEGREQ